MVTLSEVIERRLTKMITESRFVAGFVLFKIPTVKHRVRHIFPFIGGRGTLRKELRKVCLGK